MLRELGAVCQEKSKGKSSSEIQRHPGVLALISLTLEVLGDPGTYEQMDLLDERAEIFMDGKKLGKTAEDR